MAKAQKKAMLPVAGGVKQIEDIRNTVVCGDALSVLKTLPDESINMCCSSPPYW